MKRLQERGAIHLAPARALVRATLVFAALVLAGVACASAPPARLYVLASGATGAGERRLVPGAQGASAARGARIEGGAAGPDGGSRSVVIAPAALPEIVDRPQLVLRDVGNRVTILEQQRWAEPLRVGISRVVAEDLGRRLGSWRISSRDDALPNPDCRVSLDVRRFDTSRAGPAIEEALWAVVCADGAKRTGRSTAAQPLASPVAGAAFLEAAVAAHGRALDAMSRDIADALRDMRPAPVVEYPNSSTAQPPRGSVRRSRCRSPMIRGRSGRAGGRRRGR